MTPPLLLAPPPHATKAAASNAAARNPSAIFRARNLVAATNSNAQNRTTPPGRSPMGVVNWPPAVCGAVVAINSATLPLDVRALGFSEQLASVIAVGTEQVRVTVPVKPML